MAKIYHEFKDRYLVFGNLRVKINYTDFKAALEEIIKEAKPLKSEDSPPKYKKIGLSPAAEPKAGKLD